MKKILLLFLAALVFIIPTCFAGAQEIEIDKLAYQPETLRGKVIEVTDESEIDFDGNIQLYQKLRIEITRGESKGEVIEVENGDQPMAQVVEYKKGERVLVSHSRDLNGNDAYLVTDHVRTGGLWALAILFVVLAVYIGRRKGFLSLVGLAGSFAVIIWLVLPWIEDGFDPILVAIVASAIIVPLTFYLSHGFNSKTTVAMVGTFIALIITGLLAELFIGVTHLSGLTSEDSMILQTIGDRAYDLRGLLMAGIILGALGVLDDITVSQAAVVKQLREANPNISTGDLYRGAIKVGKDHIASMINTLILVYTGASLPLLLLFMNSGDRSIGDIVNLEPIATEIVRTLVGSIGLILAVPITTYLACRWKGKAQK